MMKKKYAIILLIFGFICVILPFIIEALYSIGDVYPLIHTYYTQSDILGYISGVIGLGMSLLAIIMSIQANEIKIKIHHSITCSENGNEALRLEICNQSGFDCTINSVELCNYKEHIYSHIIHKPPFDVKAKNSVDFIVETKEIESTLSRIIRNSNQCDIKYCIRLAGNNRLLLSTKELYHYLNILEEHNEKIRSIAK